MIGKALDKIRKNPNLMRKYDIEEFTHETVFYETNPRLKLNFKTKNSKVECISIICSKIELWEI